MTAETRQGLTLANGRLEPGEECDDGNLTAGDGCNATGHLEGTHYCWVPGSACSLKGLCSNGTLDSGEVCDNGAAAGNNCSAQCDLVACGNGVRNNDIYPGWAQEICDDANRYDGDGCNRLCEVEAGWACSGTPSRCEPSGVVFYNTGVGANFRVLAENDADPHWFYTNDNSSAKVHFRAAGDWPRSLQGAQYLANQATSAQGNNGGCVYQDFQIPSNYVATHFTLVIAAFNDNWPEKDAGQFFAKVNGVAASGPALVIVETPAGGQPWQKNVIYALTKTNPWRIGMNRVELCNDDMVLGPTGYRYFFADATDDQCGSGVVSDREQCDDGNQVAGDGCSATCDSESGYGCVGNPSTCALTCGNGKLNPGELCDDGNLASADGCSSACRLETGFTCVQPGSPCQAICGDGKWVVGEECDDGNVSPADGCSPTCRIATGWECSGSLDGKSSCSLQCGNGRLDGSELCDDGNRAAGDGCSMGCTLEIGWACALPGTPCAKTCGNGLAEPGEGCDDGNTVSVDGCNAECAVEASYSCQPAGACTLLTHCGDGVLDALELCDDGNTQALDGCERSCRVETGWTCGGAPSSCAETCGDSRIVGAETCDDGNLVNGDGCNSGCFTERRYACSPAAGQGPSVCLMSCGNGTLDAGEACDDGNAVDGDGCTGSCRFELGWSCSGPLGPCREVCGNGVRTPSEQCDDGNLVANDACDQVCHFTGNGNGPPILNPLAFSVTEGSLAAAKLTATDPNAGDTLSFGLFGGEDDALFSLDASTGQLTFLGAPNFELPKDLNTDNQYVVRIRVADGKGGFDTQLVRIMVTNQSAIGTGGRCAGAEDCVAQHCDDAVTHLCLAPSCADAIPNGMETDLDCGGLCSGCSAAQKCLIGADCLSGLCPVATLRCAAPGCGDGVRSASETDVDCGGGTCLPCFETKACLLASDCLSGVCPAATHVCTKATCSDGVKNGDETDLDCGGSCKACGNSKGCGVDADCTSRVCEPGVQLCRAPTCGDGVKNGTETDVDCGGGTCGACNNGLACLAGADCVRLSCDLDTKLCSPPTCTDGVKNGTETDLDCGSTCPSCADQQMCKGSGDCQSSICPPGTLLCAAASCVDATRNGDETDLDCGGTVCLGCAVDQLCKLGADCRSLHCDSSTLRCMAAGCSDQLKNGTETDLDCGGPDCRPCNNAQSCLVGGDCKSRVCEPTSHQCIAESCTDTLKNGQESDVDCGGSQCSPCATGLSCRLASDCVSQVCSSSTCVDNGTGGTGGAGGVTTTGGASSGGSGTGGSSSGGSSTGGKASGGTPSTGGKATGATSGAATDDPALEGGGYTCSLPRPGSPGSTPTLALVLALGMASWRRRRAG